MTKAEFLDILRYRLSGLPPDEIDELVDDYAMHFAEGMAAGRSEAEIAADSGSAEANVTMTVPSPRHSRRAPSRSA